MTEQQQAAANDELRAFKALNDEEIDQVSGGLSMYDFWPDKAILLLSVLMSTRYK